MRSSVAENTRAERIDQVATHLLPSASLLTRLLLKRAGAEISRTEGSVLRMLDDAPPPDHGAGRPRRARAADDDAPRQATGGAWLGRAGARGRGRPRGADLACSPPAARPSTSSGPANRAVLRDYMAGLSDEQVAALETATEALDSLVVALQHGGAN